MATRTLTVDLVVRERATDPALLANLAHARAGGEACPCVLAMGCPLHYCGCWQYRMPHLCDCDD